MLLAELIDLVTAVVVAARDAQVGEVIAQSAHIGVDRHVVVVEHDEQVVLEDGGIVEALECQATADGSIANDGHHFAVGLMSKV